MKKKQSKTTQVRSFRHKWTSVKKNPRIGGEYLVVWALGDGQYPVVTMMIFDFQSKEWFNPQGTDEPTSKEVLFWAAYPNPPAGIPKKVWG